MPLQYNDQLTMLKDILLSQGTDCCGTVAECEQLERLVKNVLINDEKVMSPQMKDALQNIYHYSQQGKYTQHLDQHILNNQEQLQNWAEQIESLS